MSDITQHLCKDKLVALGNASGLAERFLDPRNFRPQHDTILVASCARREGTRGREIFLAALGADNEADTNFFTSVKILD